MGSQPAPELLTETPHFDLPPPAQPQAAAQHGAFGHQLPLDQRFPSGKPPQIPRNNQATSEDFRHPPLPSRMPGANGNGPLPVPSGPHGRMGNGHAHERHMREMGFAGPRSPPNNKSTAHVPCKFYRQGACQAGKACPFLHSDEPITDRAPCKYFAKGNCKFGHKCALAHVLPNGAIVNRNSLGGGGGPFGRMNIPHHPEPAPNSSLLSMQAHMAPHYPPPMHDDFLAQQKPPFDMIPTIDTTFTSNAGSNYGSPPNEGRIPMSPVQKGLTLMEVPLPASFDSQGISHVARYGPIAASVPSKFLAGSPPSSFQGESYALRNLHSSAFGDEHGNRSAALGSSPPEAVDKPSGRRIMHSELRVARRGMLSASVGARPPIADDWDDSEFGLEEDLIPSSLNDLLTPQEKMRRFSRDLGDNEGTSLSHRGSLSRLGASPSSPSRFQALWGKPRANNDAAEPGPAPGVSAFGHVGSPLRNSSLHQGASPSLRPLARPTSGDAGPFVASPPRQSSMSMISQQLQRTRVTSRDDAGSNLTPSPMHPSISRVTSTSSVGSSGGRLGIDRAVSSSSIGRDRIDEEQGLFSMEEEELENGKGKDGASTTSSTSNKRLSGLSWGSGGKASPSLAPIGGHRVSANASGI
ncbi:uncharacterized protein EI97DRAFT_234526 [Westerdykella ornata]|uniref:C3H1-type domain-containing protein n=1 Tax=Westerdykella ornata TaxID=318751 RepID=A0A6A6J6U3_WESOR|nr:uncharacterized protein EI97DRAFT_234526 [Westerdykella ornata]KAF2272132.1 hypothetical protein EI97DRAFT_234526 [Westerdykella ornata]